MDGAQDQAYKSFLDRVRELSLERADNCCPPPDRARLWSLIDSSVAAVMEETSCEAPVATTSETGGSSGGTDTPLPEKGEAAKDKPPASAYEDAKKWAEEAAKVQMATIVSSMLSKLSVNMEEWRGLGPQRALLRTHQTLETMFYMLELSVMETQAKYPEMVKGSECGAECLRQLCIVFGRISSDTAKYLRLSKLDLDTAFEAAQHIPFEGDGVAPSKTRE